MTMIGLRAVGADVKDEFSDNSTGVFEFDD